MSRFEQGVRWYTRGVIEISISFPEDAVCCRYCPHMRADANGTRYKCGLTGEILMRIDKLGNCCPVIIEEESPDGNSNA